MNRIARRSLAPQLIEALRTSHVGFISATGKKLPPSVVSLYAAPEVAADGVVHWTTSLQGNPIAFKDLPTEQIEAFKALLFQKLAAIASLAKELGAEPAKYAKEISLLTQAAAAPSVDAIYSVNGQPVLLYWASSLPPDPNRKVLALPVAAAAAAAVSSTRLSRNSRWLVALLLLLLFLFLLWWFFCPKSWRVHNTGQVLTPNAVQTTPPNIQAPPQPAAPVPETLKPTDPVVPPEPPTLSKPSEPTVIPEEPVPPLIEVPEPGPELLRPRVEPPKPEPVVAPPKVEVPAKPATPKVITVDNAKTVCPEDRPAALAPEMIVVFDASSSMRVNISATAAEERWAFEMMHADPNFIASKLSPSDLQKFERLWPLHKRTEAEQDWLYKMLIAHTPGRLSPSDRQKFLRLVAEPTRIASAKQATINVLQRLPKDTSSGLVVVDRCLNGARNLGRFGPDQRGQMLSRLNNLTPYEGTPLADGLLQGGQLADGVTRESTILLVSDGAESCGGDPCFVARNLKRNKPHLKINVIDIGGVGAANCAAELTGGKVYTVSNVNELNLGIERAAQDTLGPAHCRKPN